MSILQEYETIKKEIGEEKWDSVDTYIVNYHPELSFNKIIYNPKNWMNFEKWYYRNIKLLSVKVDSFWKSDYEDIRGYVRISKGNKDYGYCTVSFDEEEFEKLSGKNKEESFTEKEMKDIIEILVARNFDNYIKLPKISECSKLLQSIYDDVCTSDSSMCHITEDDWQEFYEDEYTDKDVKILKVEVKKYNLEDVITFGDCEYKIIGWSDLETRFIDDRMLNLENDMEKTL